MAIAMIRLGIGIGGFALLLAAGWLAIITQHAYPAEEQTQPAPTQEPPAMQIIRAPEWKGAVEVGDEGCLASHGEYTVWVYATATQCGVPREQAERVVVIRQPLPGVAPIRATARVPGGSYVAWVYGAGDPGHPGLRLCGKTCALGLLSTTPGWASLGWIELRDNQLLFLRSWEQPEGHRLHIQAVVLTSSETKPDWTP
jgi:hypothetical protein